MADLRRVDDHSKQGSVGFIDRRSFLQTGLRAGAAVALTAAAGATALKLHADDTVWQIDPGLCEQRPVEGLREKAAFVYMTLWRDKLHRSEGARAMVDYSHAQIP